MCRVASMLLKTIHTTCFSSVSRDSALRFIRQLVGWPVGQLVTWPVGWLVGGLVGPSYFFWAATPKRPMTYAFTVSHIRNFFLLPLLRPSVPPPSSLCGSNPSHEAQIKLTTGEAFIGQNKYLVTASSGLGFRKANSIT